MKVRILWSLLCVFALVVPALAQSIDGKWEAKTQGRGGAEVIIAFDLKNAGGNVTGTVTQGQNPAEIKNGKLEGSNLTFETSQAGRGGGEPITVKWTGAVSGDTIKFTREFGGGGGGRGGRGGPQEIEAKRVK